MLSSIHPLGERARNNRWAITAGGFTLSAMAAGSTIGLVLGWLGSMMISNPPDWLVPLAAGVVVAAGVADLFGLGVPGPRRQVNEDWIGAFRGWIYGGGFGLQLGAGAATYVVTWSVWAMFWLEFTLADPLRGAVVGLVFGAVRATAPLLAGWIDRPSRLTAFNRAMAGYGPNVARGVGVGLVATGATIFAGAVLS